MSDPAEPWLPLAGVRVVDFTASCASAVLADLGAEVIQVEAPRTGSEVAAASRGKRSIALDLENEASREVVHKLAARAHVVLESFAAGEARRFGVDYATLRRLNGRIVYCSTAGRDNDACAVAVLAALKEGKGACLDLARSSAAARGRPPSAGEHSREILVELGFDDADIAALIKSGAVGTS